MLLARRLLVCLLLWPGLCLASGDGGAFVALRGKTGDPRQAVAVALGARLFEDERLASSPGRTCAHCHRDAVAPLAGGRDPTSLLNVSLNASFGWTGRFATLLEQVEHELVAADRVAAAPGHLRQLLDDDADYRRAILAWRGRGPRAEDVAAALTAYLDTLLTPDSPFDRYLSGEATLSADAVVGMHRFQELGCVSCHQGVNLGGNLRQRLGLFTPFEGTDRGREEETGTARDRHVFRVPGLRNVAETAPYFHDGSRRTLSEAIASMGRLQLARELSAAEIAQLTAFLGSLSAPLADPRWWQP